MAQKPKGKKAEGHGVGVVDAARQIYLAGLAAFTKAQEEGSKLFESLVKEGEAVEARARKTAEEQVEAVKGKASGTWDKLEQVFEDRVSRVLSRLGVPTDEEVKELSRRVEDLNRSVKELIESREREAPATRKARAPRGAKPSGEG